MESDLISRSELRRCLEMRYMTELYPEWRTLSLGGKEKILRLAGAFRKAIDSAPAVDAVPVVHGKFLRYPEVTFPDMRITPILCHTCNTTFATLNKNSKKAICCPYCGARMDGENDA